jgi:uroporphyrinogen decarboxylase
VRHALEGNATLIGFAGAPWTLFTYMIEGGGSKTFSKSKKWIYLWPEDSIKLLNLIADVTARYLIKQIESGAQVVQIFDSWSGEIVGEDYHKFGLGPCIDIA